MSSYQRNKDSAFYDTAVTVAYALLIAILIRTFAYEPFRIPSGSMEPTLLVGDYLFVSKFSYGYSKYSLPFALIPFEGRVLASEPERGDVVVFKKPGDTSLDYIKRVVGLPGDQVQMIDGRLYINGTVVPRRKIEPYQEISPGGAVSRHPRYMETLPGGREHQIIEVHGDDYYADRTGVYVVPEDHYFMMGDNRDSSEDSRTAEVGYVPFENLIGRAEFLFYSKDERSPWWAVWSWPEAVRWDRIFDAIQ
ncbi:signal peptidase I [Phaeovibrio sulfidiphilus]|uniref:Signal peptidase I n=1 Tax=Phaeovibrio sulfidiphilus TaxID=1220600 RepID=A0A8J6YV18_9PROT|nr:signal peptidase I [Phaeovibrio sulfidiphilus]MBE1236267.1 signal peptidase I [Phaeovibrio sulfidiphilus]